MAIEIFHTFPTGFSWDQFLEQHEAAYPSIKTWFRDKVGPQIGSGTRWLSVACDGQDVVGLAVSKKKGENVKLCHLWVAPHLRGQCVGLQLFRSATFPAASRGCVYFTAPESVWVASQGLFLPLGFSAMGTATKQYGRKGDPELFCYALGEVLRAKDRWDCELCDHWNLTKTVAVTVTRQFMHCEVGFAPPPVRRRIACPEYRPSLPRLVARRLGQNDF